MDSKSINGLALPDVDLSLWLNNAPQPVSWAHFPLRRDFFIHWVAEQLQGAFLSFIRGIKHTEG